MTGGSGPYEPDEKKRGLHGERPAENKSISLQPGRQFATGRLLANLSQQGGAPGRVSGEQAIGAVKAKMVGWVDHLFDCLAKSEYEWNRTIERPDMKVMLERPESASSVGGQLVLKGRLSTHGWSMFFRATSEAFDSYVMPSDRAISFTVNPGQFSRLLHITVSGPVEPFCWSIGNRAVAWEEIPELANWLLTTLVNISSGKSAADEVFTFSPEQQAGVKPFSVHTALTPGVPARQHAAILGAGKTPELAAKPVPGAGGHHPHVILPVPAAAVAPARSLQVPQERSVDICGADVSPPPVNGLEQGFNCIITEVDNELRILSEAGAKAFSGQNTQSVEKILRRTAALQSLRTEMISTFQLWKAKYSE